MKLQRHFLIKRWIEQKIIVRKPTVYSICVLCSIDEKYNNLALSLEFPNTVNILNILTRAIIKIADILDTRFDIGSQIHLMSNSNEDNFSFVLNSGEY